MSPALSPSRAADFKQCPLLYRFRAVDKLTGPPSPAAVRGTLVHSVLERVFDLPAHERTPEAALALVEPRWRALVEAEPELAGLLGDAELTEADWFEQARALVTRWFSLEDPTRLEPADRELYVETEVDGLVLRGYVDRLDVAPGSGAMRVVDYKTGRSPSERFEGKALFQMKFYALVLWRLHGRVPARLQLVYLGDGDVVAYSPDEAELVALERQLHAIWSAIERAARTGDWRPRTSRLCHWCDFKDLCPTFGGTPPPLPEDAAEIALSPGASAAAGGLDSAD